ncbi:hypothetical protein CVT26_000479 [Gymnopilus dilepis]|uniref:Uncharacterized protein n=1 Tax=Gymnopilus dilepis TaxID=231916 RepID=A0A409VGX8_9AGAR|nr:hypothetical protein CVT26_000479 [Gymnopilus dilepis]
MSDVAGPSVISLNYDNFLPANDLPGPSLSHGFHDVYHEPGYLKDPARVSVPSSENGDSKARREIRPKTQPLRNRTRFSVPPRPLSSSLEPVHHTPSLPFERLAFSMDLEDLKRKMMMEKQEAFQPYPPPRVSRDHMPTSSPDQNSLRYRTSAPYSTKPSRNARRLSRRSRRGVGTDSIDPPVRPGEPGSQPPILYE